MLEGTSLPSYWQNAPFENVRTPGVVYSAARLKENNRVLREALRFIQDRIHLHYAVKACTLPRVVEEFQSLGWGLEVQSLTEWRAFGKRGVSGIYNSPRKSRNDLVEAVRQGLLVIADNESEVEDIWALSASGLLPADFQFGIRIQFEMKAERFYATGCKLGMELKKAEELVKSAQTHGYPVPSWIHCHQLARCSKPEEFGMHIRQVIKWVTDIHSQLQHRFAGIDLGGGLDSPTRLELAGTNISAMANELRLALRDMPYECEVALELGRHAVADSAMGVCRVVRTKQVYGKRWAIVDIATNLLIPLPLARFSVSTYRPRPGEHALWGVADATCSPNGVIQAEAALPADLQPDEMLVIQECGAYTYSLAEQFCDPIPPALWWSEDGELYPMQQLHEYARVDSANYWVEEAKNGR